MSINSLYSALSLAIQQKDGSQVSAIVGTNSLYPGFTDPTFTINSVDLSLRISNDKLSKCMRNYIKSMYYFKNSNDILTDILTKLLDIPDASTVTNTYILSQYKSEMDLCLADATKSFQFADESITQLSSYISSEINAQANIKTNNNNSKQKGRGNHYENTSYDNTFTWYIPILQKILHQLRKSSALADRLSSGGIYFFFHTITSQLQSQLQLSLPSTTSSQCSRRVYDILMDMIRALNLARNADVTFGPLSSYLLISTTLLKTLLRMGATDRCVNIITQTENAIGKQLHNFSQAQQATYSYYCGIISLYREQYTEATTSLGNAYLISSQIPVRSRNNNNNTSLMVPTINNTTKILTYLLPLLMLKGYNVAPYVCKQYQFPEYYQLASAIKSGNLLEFQQCIQKYEQLFFSRGTIFVIEACKNIVFQNLCRKVLQAKIGDDGRVPKIRYSHLLAALRIDGIEMSAEELECILVNLIYDKKIKGYIVQGVCVIVDKSNPIPKAT